MDKKILIIQTAFLGDVILTLPLVQVIKKNFLDSSIDLLCIPSTAELLKNNPYINEIIPYDKKNSGINGFINLIKKFRTNKYDLLFSPHRSFRSSLISYFSSARETISFDKSSFNFLYNVKVPYLNNVHEIQRNLKLLEPAGIFEKNIVKPELFTSIENRRKIDSIFYEYKIKPDTKIISIAPGSVWFTKRFPEEKFVKLCNLLNEMNCLPDGKAGKIFLIGGKSDKKISDFILNNSKNKNIINVTGNLSILESTELIKKSNLLITNDSAPLHIANAVGTNVIALFGSTVPSFGFYPFGENDVIFETNGLPCRPCSIHGRNKCPIGTFVCMWRIKEEDMFYKIKTFLS